MTLASLDLLAPVVADAAAHLGALDRLSVDAGDARRLLPTGLRADPAPKGIDDPLPTASAMPGDAAVPDRTLGHKVVRQIVPLAAGSGLIHQRVDHLTQIDRARPSPRLGGR